MKRTSIAQKTRKRTTIKNTERKNTLRKEPNISSFQVSEGIVKVILDKIISISIHQSDMNQINSQLNDYCFGYIHAQMEPLLEENFINYTKLKNDPNTFFWKNKKQPENQWIEIFEPETVETDRFESSTVKVQEIPKKKETINEINEGIEHNENAENNEKDNTKKTRTNKEKTVRINISRPNGKKEETNINNENNKENNADNKTRINQTPKTLNLNLNNRGGKKKVPMIDFPSEEIPGIDNEFKHEKYDPPNIHILGKDIEEEIKNKEKESKLNNNKIKSVKLKEDLEKLNKNIKPLDTNKFTFDSNGKIISFKQYKLDNLSKDFTFIRNTIREKEEKEEKGDIKNKLKKLSIKEPSNVVVIKDNNRMNEFNTSEEKKDKAVREKIIPSGSNFKLILPNIGVVVKENNNQKEGGKDFNKYFKKYSITDYDKILNEYVPLQNRSKIKNRFERMNLTSTIIQKQLSESLDKSNNNTINNTQINMSTINNKRKENMNPLLTSNDNIQINDTNTSLINQNSSYMKTAGNNSITKNSILYNPIMTSANMRSAFINYTQDKRGNNFADSIIMKKLGSSSLKMEIDSLQDLKTKPNYRKIKSIKKENLFDKNFIRNNRLGLNNKSRDNPFLAFNKKILTDANFGNAIDQKNTTEKENIVISRHLNMQEAFRELGNSMISGLKIKFPRNRKVELSK